jgi:hypothetical protein
MHNTQDFSLLVLQKWLESGFDGLPGEFTQHAFLLPLLNFVVQSLAPLESTYQGEMWDMTTVESLTPSLSSTLGATSTGKFSAVNSTPAFPDANQKTTTTGDQPETNNTRLTVGLGVAK